MKPILYLYVFFVTPLVFGANDTVFSYEEYISIVLKHHPITYQANAKAKQGDAYVTKARGAFDPKLQGDIAQKYYKETTYYSYVHAGLKIPTWYGLTLGADYNQNEGTYLSRESTTPLDGLWSAGITANIGRGLFLDDRRAELKQAKIYQESTLQEQKLMLNQLKMDASMAYWDWFKAYNKVLVYQNALINARLRLTGVKGSIEFGDKPGIDSVEASIQVQNRALKLEQALLEAKNKKAYLEVFLWQEGYVPLEIDSTLAPSAFGLLEPSPLKINIAEDTLLTNHPMLVLAQNKLAIAKIDFRLSRENLKPTLALKYNAITSGVDEGFNTSNYTWGATVSYPIFTRKERGDLRVNKLEMEQQEAGLAEKKAILNYKIANARNSWESSLEQVEIYRKTVVDYQRLLQAEMDLFGMGESSLFMINSREKAKIDAELAYIEILYTNQLAKHTYDYHLCVE